MIDRKLETGLGRRGELLADKTPVTVEGEYPMRD